MTSTRPPFEIPERRPTRRHRLALAPGILSTVYGVNAAGEARYFDYDYAAAYAYAGVTADADPRRSRPTEAAQYVHSGATEANPGPRTVCVWVREESA